jgi:hypothetical protein
VKGAGSDEGHRDTNPYLTDDQTFHALGISPFASVHQIARMTPSLKTRMYRHFTESLNLANKKLRWVPHNLSEEQKRMRVEKSNELPQTLILATHHFWRYIVTLDKLWFYLSTDHKCR